MTEKIPMIADVRAAAAALPPFVMDTAMGPQLAKECAARLSHSWEMDPASSPTVLTGIASSQKALALSAAMQSFRTAIVVVPEQKDIFRWEEDLAFFLPETPIYSFPLVEETGFQVTFSGSERLRDRMRTLGAMLTGRTGIILATAVEAAQKVVSPSLLEESAFQVSVGEAIGWNALQEKLTSAGYERVDQVERCGHFAVRGDIIDIFPINEEHPVRIELFDDEVDSVRLFDEDTQRSIDDRKSQLFLPLDGQGGGEALVFSYLSKALVFYDEPQRCEEALKRYFKEDAAHKKAALSWKDVIGQARKAKNKEIVAGYKEFYKNAKFTHYVDKAIDLKQVVNTNKCLVHVDKYGDKLLITSCIDNLLKGAVGQAVQNMNIMFGLDQTAGLKLKPSAF